MSGPSSKTGYIHHAASKTALVLQLSSDEVFAQRIAQALHHARLRVYASNDVTGVEIGGAVKNVMAIAAGVCDGMKLGYNARAALITLAGWLRSPVWA